MKKTENLIALETCIYGVEIKEWYTEKDRELREQSIYRLNSITKLVYQSEHFESHYVALQNIVLEQQHEIISKIRYAKKILSLMRQNESEKESVSKYEPLLNEIEINLTNVIKGY